LLLAAGAVTSIPLLFFGAAARRLPLSIMGLMQYIAPIMQFSFGVFIMGEPMPPERWWGFALVWVALILLSVDALRSRHNRSLRPVELP
jgi:chloramphenicol-sensitive protein RarD